MVVRLPAPAPAPAPDDSPMPFDHERLEVYQVALEFFDLADEVVEHLPRGRGHLSDQLTRASLSIVNNIAEGAGKFSKGDKRRYYLSAMGSSTESAAMLDVCLRRKLISDETHRQGKQLLDRIVAMLTKLAKMLQDA
ncbi:MAG: four helix bundle protein [Deltaproteobacteria bacterium CG_4_9_14_3_um_filter_63_12]|nr:MAG: four helix bundle protein [Deltaproteobacteria bacterium CG_4_9_14_3_um_filter_63_12]